MTSSPRPEPGGDWPKEAWLCPRHGLIGRDSIFHAAGPIPDPPRCRVMAAQNPCLEPVEPIEVIPSSQEDARVEERNRWIRLFNRLEAAVRRHIDAKSGKGFTDEHDDALHAAYGKVLRDAGDRGAAITHDGQDARVRRLVEAELDRAVTKFGPMASAHEGWAVIQEEVDELWVEVKGGQDQERMRDEAVQVAAMAMRFVSDVTPFHHPTDDDPEER